MKPLSTLRFGIPRSAAARVGVLLLAWLLCAATARADTSICVNTAAEILDAFEIANEEAVTIKVVQGSYQLAASPHTRADGDNFFGHDIRLYGGYNSDCSTRSLDPKQTTLSTSGDFIVFTRDSLYIGSIRFRDIPGYLSLGAWSSYSGPDEQVSLSRVWVENVCHPNPANCGGLNVPVDIGSDQVSLSQVVVVRNPTAECSVKVSGNNLDWLSVNHSVFADNDGDGLCVGENIVGDEGFSVVIANSIFRNNGGVDIRTRLTSDVSLRNNIYAQLDASPALDSAPSGTLNVDPLFLNPASSSYAIAGTSPAVNSGSLADSILLSEDINGGPRIVGSAPDRGAYETTVQDSNLLFVTTTADLVSPVPAGSLRAAILASNADSDLNTIRFDIAGGCPRIINLAGPLPNITDRVVIEGYSQPGSAVNTDNFTFSPEICIGIVGDLSDDHAFRIPASAGAGEYLDLSGVAVGGFDVAAVRLDGGANSRIHGVQLGDDLDGSNIPNNAVNIRTSGDSRNNRIGGESNADRNLIGEAYVAGIQMLADSPLVADSDNVVENNMIGTSPGGTQRAANEIGIDIRTGGNTVRDNLISGNQSHGVLIEGAPATLNIVIGNRIGPKASSLFTCLPPCPPDFFSLGNVGMGVLVQGGASQNIIIGNTIAYNAGKGVRLFSGQRNSVYTNAIYENGALAIDTGDAGVNDFNNDAEAAEQSSANRGINWPFVAHARGAATSGTVTGTIMSTNGTYLLQVFSDNACDALGHGEARRYVDNASVTVDNADPGENGTAQFAIPIESVGSLTGRAISVTATDNLGNTSELSNCVTYTLELQDALFGDGFESP